jgi:phycocyanin beta chain
MMANTQKNRWHILNQAEAEKAFVSSEELTHLKKMIQHQDKRLDAVKTICDRAGSIVSDAVHETLGKAEMLIREENQDLPEDKLTHCLQESETILRYITYALFAENASRLETGCLADIRETYLGLGIAIESAVKIVERMKAAAIAVVKQQIFPNPEKGSGELELLEEIEDYFELTLTALTQKSQPIKSGGILNIEEIQQRYPNQWVLIGCPKLDEELNVIQGEVLARASEGDELYAKLSLRQGKPVAIEYTGSVPENIGIML